MGVVRQVPVPQVQVQERVVEVPQVQVQERVVEVPQIQTVERIAQPIVQQAMPVTTAIAPQPIMQAAPMTTYAQPTIGTTVGAPLVGGYGGFGGGLIGTSTLP